MIIKTETTLENFDAWSGAVNTLDTLIEKDLCDQLEQIIENDIFPNGCSDTELNDFLWFECDAIAEWLGFSSWEDLENDGKEEEEEEEEDGENNFSKWCECNGYNNCIGCPYEHCISLGECENNFYKDFTEQEDNIRTCL